MSIAADSYGIVYFSYNHPRITAIFQSIKYKKTNMAAKVHKIP